MQVRDIAKRVVMNYAQGQTAHVIENLKADHAALGGVAGDQLIQVEVGGAG